MRNELQKVVWADQLFGFFQKFCVENGDIFKMLKVDLLFSVLVGVRLKKYLILLKRIFLESGVGKRSVLNCRGI